MLYNRYRGKGEAPLEADDFMFRSPDLALEREEEIAGLKKQHMIAGLTALAQAQGGRTTRRRKKARS